MSKGYTVEVYKDGFVSNKTSVAKTVSGMVTVDVSLEPVDVIDRKEIILKPFILKITEAV
jgi:hypothetical protein